MSTQQSNIRRVEMPGLSRPVSVVALGTAAVETDELADDLFGAFVERGGNLFDSAWIYGEGICEQVLGDWLVRCGARGDVVIIGKGAHTPDCTPAAIREQLGQSLERLQVESLDVYMMHRDDPDVPVGEFIDVIGAAVAAGHIQSYGFSNWTLDRVNAAVAYAREAGLPTPTAVSNNFSLAEMVEPVWEGCLSANEEEWRARFAQGDLGLYAWSSQARGFFTERAGPDKRDDAELVRCWYSERNFGRRARALELARQRGCNGNHVALAYCLNQDFPLIPLIGPLTRAELHDSLGALEIELTSDECRWLEGG